jgi:uncharacterized protein (DUF486 family)
MIMNKQVATLLQQVKAGSISFKDVIAFIEQHYQHQPTAFRNGSAYNEATQNQGSAKVFTFAQLHQMNEVDTLALFAEHYQAVLKTPEGSDHQNIRQFMLHGWAGIVLEGQALLAK